MGIPRPKSPPGKLKQSTQKGLRVDVKALNGQQQAVTPNSVVNPCSVFVELTIFDENVEAVCDCGGSVFFSDP